RFDVTVPNVVHQADLLFLPADGKSKYALVVVDVASRRVDAEPLTSKAAGEVKKGFQRIYKRHAKGEPLSKPPEKLEVDPGAEFKGEVDKYFSEQKTVIRRGDPGRHRS